MNPLIGREHVLSTLVSHLDAVSQGSGGCVIVEGPFGIGKTHLLKAATMEGAERGLTVVAGQASGSDQPVPIHLLINLLRHVMSGEADFDDLVRPDRNPFWLMDRVGELVECAARRHPLVIVLDDAQRIDDVSGLALRGLVQSLASSPVLWLLAHRPVPTRSLAQHALGWLLDHAAVRLPLSALDQEAVAELSAGILGAAPDASVLGWVDSCGGNPWLVENLLDALVQAGQVVIVDGKASVVADRLPEGVVRAVSSLLGEMPHAVRRLLVSGRRIGRTFRAEEAAASLGGSAPDVSSSVDWAVSVGLVRREGAELAFRHGVIEEALAHGAFQEHEPLVPETADGDPQTPPADPPSPVLDRQPAVGGVASAQHELPERVPAPPIVMLAAPPAPQSAECACYGTAARALSALGDAFDEVPRRLAGALRLLAGAGRGTEAVRLADLALRPGIAAAAEAQLVLQLSQGLRDTDRSSLSAEFLRRTLSRHDVGESDRAELHGALAEITKGADGIADPATTPRPARSNGPVPAGVSRRGPGWGLRPAASSTCDTCERPLWTWLVRALGATDQFEEATAVLEAVKQEAERFNEAWPELLWYGHHAELLAATGRHEEARGEAEAALRLADRSAPEDTVPARVVLARLSMHRGDLATAEAQLRVTEQLVTGEGVADKGRLDWALALFHAASGRPAAMVRTLINIEGRVAPDPLLFTESRTAAAMLVRLAKQAGLATEAERAAEFARHIASRNPGVQSLAGCAEHAEGVLRNDMVALHRAVELYRHARPLAAGSALEDAAEVERSMGNRTRTIRLLESAMDLYLDSGAQRDMARAQKKLRRLGVHEVREPGADRPKSGWESLTGAELRVVRAIVDGKTNREAASMLFLSPHTVDSHLRRVFSKLHINSRVELTKHFIVHGPSPITTTSHRPGSAC
ncbi:BREX system ATP-binding domain-containing protein [Streptomyces sp. NPDC099050]|uniref:helix-turn-helix transcriptional regulator n=1 Tax=Streptomyces sp. NPDC099050 TaxID=3366100 RepID=UPI0038149C7C